MQTGRFTRHWLPESRSSERSGIVRELSPASQIVIVGSVPHWHKQLPKIILRRRSGLDEEYYLRNERVEELTKTDEVLRAVSADNDVEFVSPVEELCGTSGCLATVRYEGRVMPTTWDMTHLTTELRPPGETNRGAGPRAISTKLITLLGGSSGMIDSIASVHMAPANIGRYMRSDSPRILTTIGSPSVVADVSSE